MSISSTRKEVVHAHEKLGFGLMGLLMAVAIICLLVWGGFQMFQNIGTVKVPTDVGNEIEVTNDLMDSTSGTQNVNAKSVINAAEKAKSQLEYQY